MQQKFYMQAFLNLLSKIHRREYSPFYLLSGNESFFIDRICNALIGNLVNDTSKDFDFSQFYGKESSASEIIEAAKRFPMLSKYNLVVIKEAQFMDNKEIDILALYANKPMLHSIIIFCFKGKVFDKRKKLYKEVAKYGEILTVKPLYENQLNSWVKNQIKNRKLTMSPEAIELLTANIGSDLTRIDSELMKLNLSFSEDEIISKDHIEKHIGISKKYNIFELQKALGQGDFSNAFKIIQFLNENSKENPIVLILSGIHSYFQKLLLIKSIGGNHKRIGINPYFIKEYENAAKRFSMKQLSKAMEHILIADLESKGIKSGVKSSKEITEGLLLKLFTL